MSNTIYNPAAGACIYTIAGAATAGSEFTGAKVKGGAVIKISNTSQLDGVSLGQASGVSVTQNAAYRGLTNGVGAALLDATVTGILASSSGGYCAYTGLNLSTVNVNDYVTVSTWSSVAPGSSLNIVYGTQKVTQSNNTDAIVTTLPYSTAISGNQIKMNVHTSGKNWNKQVARQYIVQCYNNKIAGTASTILLGGSHAGVYRSIHKVEAVRTTKVTTGLRNGYYNRYTGKWNTVLSISSDGAIANSTITSDAAAAPTQTKPGELCYKTGRPRPWDNANDGIAYSAKTTW